MIYKKKSIIIEAIKYDGVNWEEIHNFVGGLRRGQGFLEIHTLEGDMRARPGDYIIRGIKGEFYPCKPDIFEKTYDKWDGDLTNKALESEKQEHC